ncbi:MAG: T9SS type A sorting domain-containing protein [Bacteroidales bacterium]|nr:T9SS type A sorting domain-containing protein [Bacteroidales bacterium]
MKKITLLFVLLLGVSIGQVFSQQWKQNLPQEKSIGEYTFFDYQKAFNDYWTPLNVVGGYYINEEGEKQKAPGWKQFKRWEWYWKTRVDNVTGEFPNTNAWLEWEKYQKDHPETKSQLGNWVTMGPANLDRAIDDGALQENGTGRLNCAAFDPNDNNHFWIGAPAGGVWETTNAGSTWTCLTDENPIIGVSDIALPSDYNKTSNPTIYIATGDRDAVDDPSIGVLKTTDGGTTWNTTGLTFGASENSRIGGLECSESDPNTIVAATFKGIYKSTDAGATWTNVQSGLFIDMDLIPGTNTLIATTMSTVLAYRSTDFGSTWSVVFTGTAGAGGEYRVDVATTGASATVVYLISSYYDTDALYAIYKSTNAGASFSKVYDGLTKNNLFGWNATNTEADGGQGWYDIAFAVSNTNSNVVYVGGVNAYVSSDGAANFTIANGWRTGLGCDVVHADHHNAYFRPSDNRLFDVNDGGVYYCDNVTSGTSSDWYEITDGIITGQIYDIGISQNADGYIVAGFQDNGTKLLTPTDDEYGWEQVKGGDGMCCAIDPTNFNTQWGTYVQLQVDRTTNLWGSASSLRNSGGAAWAGPLEVDPQGTSLYIGTDAVEWDAAKGPLPPSFSDLSQSLDATNYLSALDIFNDGSNKMIWTASPTGCWKSPLGGSGTYTLLSNLPANAVTDIAIDEDDYNHVYVCFGGYDNINVYETTNGGTSWTDISAGLPAVPTGAIVINEDNTTEHEVYVGTDAGIYVKLGNAPWQLFNNGMPFVSITDLEMYYGATPAIYAATYGRGIWKGDCYDPPALDLAIGEIVVPVTEYCAPGTFIPTITISNIGTTTITSATVQYSIDGGAPVSQNWTGSLARGASTNVTFPAATLVVGTHLFEAEISNPNGTDPDENEANDFASTTYALWDHSMQYTQDFDDFPLGGNTNNYDGSNVALSECWVNESSDDIDWSVNSGVSPSGSTGPTADHTSGSGVYLYTESSGANGNKNLKVSSPVLDLTNYTGSEVTFWYHMYGANMGSLQIDLFYGGSNHTAVPVYWASTGSTTTSISGDQGNQWYEATVDISAADGENDLVFTFNAQTGADYLSEMAIDDFNVTGTPSVVCTYPTTQASNFGATPALNSINVSWTRGNGNQVIVLAKQGSAVDANPVDGTTYTANAAFGSGTQIGAGNYVVYIGPATGVNVTALTASTTYHFAIYEYNTTGNCYLVPALTGNSTTTAPPAFNWSGAVSSDWQNTGNWSTGSIPTSSDDITIPNGMPNYPVIDDGATTAECNNITIENAASVTIATNGQMTVSGAITNNAGNTGLIINSDASGTGSLIHNSGAGVSASVDLYLDASTRRWHMLASPVASAPLSVFPSTTYLFEYDESIDDYWTGTTYNSTVNGWTAPVGNMVVAQGYVFNYPPTTLNFTGTLNPSTATSSITIDYSDHGASAPNGSSYDDFDGWNFIGNPFTSALDWDNAAVNHAGANLLDAVYYYDDLTAHTYASYVGGVGTNGGTRYIPAMQGFFVKGDNSETGGTLNIGAGARIHNSQAFWKGNISETPENLIRLTVSANNFDDETVIRMHNDATNYMDNGFDAYKLFTMENNIPQIYSKINGVSTEYSINTIPDITEGTAVAVPLFVNPSSGTFSLSVSELTFDGITVYLKDNLSNSDFRELKVGEVISFTASEYDENGRFVLIFEKSSATGLNNVTENSILVYPNPTTGSFFVSIANYAQTYDVVITNVTGQVVYTDKLVASTAQEINLDNAAGVYFMTIKLKDQTTFVKKIVIQ